MSDALTITGLTKRYENGTEALKGVSLSIPEGDFFALLGPNGAGKTTIIGITTGIVTKTSGEVSVFGTSIDVEPDSVKSHIGIVPQEVNFNIFEKPLDIVMNQGGYYGMSRAEALPRAHELLEKLGLGDKKEVMSRTLSGGMKRRLMIARALIHRPKLLILDEPTAGVDVELRRGMWDFLKTLTSDGVTILLTTHYLEEAEHLCKRVAIINKGLIVKNTLMSELLSNQEQRTFIIEAAHPINPVHFEQIKKLGFRTVSQNSVEITVSGDGALTESIKAVLGAGILVHNVVQKGGRLEDIFVSLTT
jgi:ABC-2 type transport system ATP-binding protein